MDTYGLLLFFHIVCVIVWLGAGTTLALTASFAGRTRDRSLLEKLPALGRWLGPRVFAPASLGAFGFGIALVRRGARRARRDHDDPCPSGRRCSHRPPVRSGWAA